MHCGNFLACQANYFYINVFLFIYFFPLLLYEELTPHRSNLKRTLTLEFKVYGILFYFFLIRLINSQCCLLYDNFFLFFWNVC